ncbi:MAG: zinc-dependent peptidase [Acidimicrobiia bacterium]|nr:MAG: zinc-dependent peptidase [Acidimicrobiia bacterium]
MRFELPRQRRRRKAIEAPFPQEWRAYLDEGMAHWRWLDDVERSRLEELIKGFLHDKRFEWSNSLDPSDEIRVLVAASACLLILGLERAYFRDVGSIIMYPTGVVVQGKRGSPSVRGLETESIVPILGEAALHGPMVIVWDSAQRAAAHPQTGHNVIYHEFAHKIDMADGSADGTPPMSVTLRESWEMVAQEEFRKLQAGENPHPFLDAYGGVNRAEFFAVATEFFFDQPVAMEKHMPGLYAVLRDFYRQDTAERERRQE